MATVGIKGLTESNRHVSAAVRK